MNPDTYAIKKCSLDVAAFTMLDTRVCIRVFIITVVWQDVLTGTCNYFIFFIIRDMQCQQHDFMYTCADDFVEAFNL